MLYRRLQSNKVEYKLSILILSLPKRLKSLEELLYELNKQKGNRPVQILYLGDNKSITVGEKRNHLMSMAKGRYITFIDDDDAVSEDYLNEILGAIESNPEVITFNFIKTHEGANPKEYRYFMNNGPVRQDPVENYHKMSPNHLCVWRKDIIKEDFPHINLSEDHRWAKDMELHYNQVHNIDMVLYFYRYSKENSETH